MPGNIGWQGLVLILLVLLVVFGPKRLPELGRSLGRGMREFKDSVSGDHDHERKEDAAHVEAEPHEIGPAPNSASGDVVEPQPRERDTVV
jgi:sec-independent protein translocase protein TatA